MNVITAQLSPRGKQRVWQVLNAVLIKELCGRRAVFKQWHGTLFKQASSLARHQPRKPAFILNVAPVLATRIGKEDMYVDVFTQRTQRLQIHRRQRRDAADKHARGQPGWSLSAVFQYGDKPLVEVCTVPLRLAKFLSVFHQRFPERRLPDLRLR